MMLNDLGNSFRENVSFWYVEFRMIGGNQLYSQNVRELGFQKGEQEWRELNFVSDFLS